MIYSSISLVIYFQDSGSVEDQVQSRTQVPSWLAEIPSQHDSESADGDPSGYDLESTEDPLGCDPESAEEALIRST
jgi:hypothetical protein